MNFFEEIRTIEENKKIIEERKIKINDGNEKLKKYLNVVEAKHKILGKGTYGKVYNYNNDFCLKKGIFEIDEEMIIDLLNKISHENICEIYKYYFELGFYILEKLDINLFNYKTKERFLNKTEKNNLFLGICEGVAFLHEKKIFHLDLRTPNIMLNIENKIPKIIDFSLSLCGKEKVCYCDLNNSKFYPADFFVKDDIITINPEKIDSWALGHLFYFIMSFNDKEKDYLYKDHKFCKHADTVCNCWVKNFNKWNKRIAKNKEEEFYHFIFKQKHNKIPKVKKIIQMFIYLFI
jgi:serine/threonine protein kinase